MADPATAGERRAGLAELAARARACTRCPQLAAGRTTVVFGSGDPDADLLLVGEAPGQNEDRQGVPLVGAPRRLLNELLAEVGLARDAVFLTHLLRCRPPDNRDPLPEELDHCHDYLLETLALVQPKVVCTLGTLATRLLRGDPRPLRAVHGRPEVRTIGATTVRLLPLFHPAAALYQPTSVEQLRRDVARLPALLELPRPQPVVAPEPDPAPAAEEPPAPDPPSDVQLGLF
ncbi:uracil-DNA glycosylase [Patulibacter defluvii]|uniref:uracil-DNA glycosylase n=1 Tax=Patulibacter defluvii TaxID=3095358 RepID=UPI002A762C7A|nr:uracil-DNA glycosylase [Patulibacter sp. DM4]